jgi:hypothetical protein
MHRLVHKIFAIAIGCAISLIGFSTYCVSSVDTLGGKYDRDSFSIFDDGDLRVLPDEQEQVVFANIDGKQGVEEPGSIVRLRDTLMVEDDIKENEVDPVKIVAFTDKNYSVTSKWWYNRMTKLGYTTHTLVLIDPPAVKDFTDANRGGKEYYRFEVQIIDPGSRAKNRVRSLWYNRILYCLNQLKAGHSLLLTDVDNIFSRYEPLSQFQGSEFDAIFALEQKFPVEIFQKQGFVLCGGMTFLKATNATVEIMERLLEKCDGGTKRCDDQVEWNRMMFLDMTWNTKKTKTKLTENGLIQYSFSGESKTVQGFKAKVWDRDFAWRGPFDTERCPSESNWVAMPTNLPYSVSSQLRAEGIAEGASRIGIEKIARVKIWEEFCGINGTNRDENQGSVKARLNKAVQAYNKTTTRVMQ